MNNELQAFAREQLKEGLARCTEGQQHIFKRMYAHKNLKADINDVVDAMPDEKLDWAMQQVQCTLNGGWDPADGV